MSILSITAPQFTPEDERLEQEELTPEETEAAKIDLLGEALLDESTRSSLDASVRTDEEVANILQEFHEGLAALEPEEKAAFLEAMEKVPRLVDLESPPLDFVTAENYNTWAAAERAVNYWELRAWLFGERAWLPMTSTGNGCLSKEDCALLETGFCSILDENADASGRGVLCFEVPPRKLPVHRMSIVRVIFYLMSVAHERRSVRKKGLVVVADTKNYTTSHFDRKFTKSVAYLFMGYHPVNTKAYHMCAPPGHKSCFLLVLPFIKYLMNRHIRQRFLVHNGHGREVAVDLEQYGIDKQYLPMSLGGTKTLDDFDKFLSNRRAVEQQREASLFGNGSMGGVDGI
ncbi:MAG: hypothetical protein SGILL_009656 [Bacillariaceae sp.]